MNSYDPSPSPAMSLWYLIRVLQLTGITIHHRSAINYLAFVDHWYRDDKPPIDWIEKEIHEDV